MLRVFGDHGINWIHYMAATFNDHDMTVEVHYIDRFHKYDNPNHPEVTEWLDNTINSKLVWEPSRAIVSAFYRLVAVKHEGKTYRVVNQDTDYPYHRRAEGAAVSR